MVGPGTVSRIAAVAAAEAGGPGVTASLFLSLILLVLAFFIVMVSISTPDADRSARVIDSVAGAFAYDPPGTPGSMPAPAFEGAQRGDVIDGEDFEQSLKGLFATELAFAEFKPVVPGRVLAVSLSGEELFYPRQARLRAAASRLLDRLVATVTLRPPGHRVEVASLIGSRTSMGGDLPVTPSALAVRRAGALGEALVRGGLPRRQLTVGLSPGEDNRIVLVFSLAAAEGGSVVAPAFAATMPEWP